MKKNNKKQIASISSIIIVLFIAPLIVFAAIYFSSNRKNSFAPGSVDIAVNEGSGSSMKVKNLQKIIPGDRPVKTILLIRMSKSRIPEKTPEKSCV